MVVAVGEGAQQYEYHEQQGHDEMDAVHQDECESSVAQANRHSRFTLAEQAPHAKRLSQHEPCSGDERLHQSSPKDFLPLQTHIPAGALQRETSCQKQSGTDPKYMYGISLTYTCYIILFLGGC